MSENEGPSENLAEPYVVFYIQGESVDPDQVTKMLGISPHRKIRKGDPDGKKGNKWSIGLWQIKSIRVVQNNDLEDHIEWVLEQLEPVKANLYQIISQDGVEAIFKVVFNLFVHEWDDQISINMMQRIADLKVKFGISFYYLEDLNERLNGEKPWN